MRKALVGLGIGLGVAMVLGGLWRLGVGEGWQMRLADLLFLPRPVSDEIVIVAIDDKSLQEIGRWPWDRSIHARLIDRIGGHAAAIGLDVSFPEPGGEGDKDLASAMKEQGNVVVPATVSDWKVEAGKLVIESALPPIPDFANVAKIGVVNKLTDADGVVRRTPVEMKGEDGQVWHNFSTWVLAGYSHRPAAEIDADIPTENGFMRINFAGKSGAFQRYSYVDVLEGRVDLEKFAGKMVLIGATALDLQDNQVTPISGGMVMDGVEIHANTIQTIWEKKYLLSQKWWGGWLEVVVGCISLAIVGVLFPVWLVSVVGGGLLSGYLVWSFYRFDQGEIKNLIFFPLGLVLVYGSVIIYKYLVENKQKRFIKKALGYYLSESVMTEVLKDPKRLALGGQRKEISVLFSDIAGFTTISEKTPPETLALLLNKYLTRMTKLVFKFNGVLDKYIGDAVMAFWGAPISDPDHAFKACETAMEMQREIQNVKQDWKEYADADFGVRIGINSGEAVVGNMGSEMRFDYSLLGDTVNLGSRLEGINKEYGTKVMISEFTYEKVKGRVAVRLIDVVAVKGKERGVAIYELMGIGMGNFEQAELTRDFEAARSEYAKGNFKKALSLFVDVEKKYADDSPTKTYISRCRELIKYPPEEWTGVFHAKSK
jgi:adenylate cyclase